MAITDIVITCYNKEKTIARAIKSVQQQTLKDFFCVIVDDGSTDNSWDVILKEIENDERFIAIQLENSGVANARNTGLGFGNAPYCSCLDGDDGLYPEFLKTCYDAILEDRSLGIVYTEVLLYHPNNNFTIRDWPDSTHNNQFDGLNQVPCCNMFRRDIFNRAGGYKQRYAPNGAGTEDAELWLKFFELGYKAKKISEEPLFIYSAFGGATQTIQYKETDWTGWHNSKPLPSLQAPNNGICHAAHEYDNPEVSIIIPVGPSHTHLLIDALDSIEAQTFTNLEVIVVFDVEESVLDGVQESNYYETAYPYVKFIYTSGGLGAGMARNIGVEYSKGKYLSFLDADDHYQPKFLEETLNAINAFDADWVYTDLYTQVIYDRNQYLEKCNDLDKDNLTHFVIKEKNDLVEFVYRYVSHEWSVNQLHNSGIAAVTGLYKRSDFDLVGGFDEINNREDWDFHLRLAKAGKCGLRLPLPLFTYRLHTGTRREYKEITQGIEESKIVKKLEVERLRNTYNLEELQMACTSCKKNKVNIQTVNDTDLTTLIYTGKVRGGTTRGPVTGRPYAMSNKNGIAYIEMVHPQDAESLIVRGTFKPVQIQKPTETKVISSPTPKPVKITKISHEERLKIAMAGAQKAREGARKQMEIELAEWEKKPDNSTKWYEEESTYKTIKILVESINKHKPSSEELNKIYDIEVQGKARKGALSFILEQLKQLNTKEPE